MSEKQNNHLFPYDWKLSDGFPAKGIPYHGCKAFGTFICGGGSSMGYKLAGYGHLGGVELDERIASIYEKNLHPRFLYNMDIREFNELGNLPDELYNLDLLDGSPPCSTFSMAGSREKAWGKKKRFAEGQKMQTLDDLVFVYCDTIKKLHPKVCLLENVSGIVKGNGKAYSSEIYKRLDSIGYRVQVFLLNAMYMGVPQRRERVFFIGIRKEYDLPKLVLSFHEEPIKFGEIKDGVGRLASGNYQALWGQRRTTDRGFDDIKERVNGKRSDFNTRLCHSDRVLDTLCSQNNNILFDAPVYLSDTERMKAATFPLDYQTDGRQQFLTGMCVPPVMTAQIAWQIYLQWLSKISK